MLELGAFELVLKQLASDDRDVVSACIGCMWGYLEFGMFRYVSVVERNY